MDLAEIVRSQREIAAPRRRRRRLPRQRKLRAAGTAASDMATATREIRALGREAQRLVREKLFPVLKSTEDDFLQDAEMHVVDNFSDDLQAAIDEIRTEMSRLNDQRANIIGQRMTGRVDERNRQRFFSSVESVVGINLSSIVDEADLRPLLALKTRQNVGLIKSISEDYLDQVERLVLENVVEGRTSSRSMITELRDLGAKTDKRAKFIARDQTAKLNATLNQHRNQALGITEYIWRTVGDERVRKTHRAHNGKKFRWDDPPNKTGHPGFDFQCRCTASPLIVV